MKSFSEYLYEAVRYNVDGELLTKANAIKKAKYKTIKDVNGKVAFEAVLSDDGDSATVIPLSFNEFIKSKLPLKDVNDSATKAVVKNILKYLSMGDVVDINGDAKFKSASPLEQLEYLLKKYPKPKVDKKISTY